MAICTEGTVVTWAHMYQLGQQLDAAAEALNLVEAGYAPIGEDTTLPFTQATVKNATIGVRYYLDTGNAPSLDLIRTKGKIMNGVRSDQVFPFDATLTYLYQNNELFFVHEEDQCWCCSVFRITDEDGPVLDMPEEQRGCYQHMPLPGFELDYSQVIIPAGYVATYGNDVPQPAGMDEIGWFQGDKCRRMSGGVYFHMVPFNNDGTVTYSMNMAQRGMRGYFTWQIKKRYFDALWEKIIWVLEHACGAKAETFRWAGTADFLGLGCEPEGRDLVWTVNSFGGGFEGQPGIISLNESQTAVQFPWEISINAAESCDADLKLYCNVINQLEAIITKLADLRPYSATDCCPTCSGTGEFAFDHGCDCADYGYDLKTPVYAPGSDDPITYLTLDTGSIDLGGIGEIRDGSIDIASMMPGKEPVAGRCLVYDFRSCNVDGARNAIVDPGEEDYTSCADAFPPSGDPSFSPCHDNSGETVIITRDGEEIRTTAVSEEIISSGYKKVAYNWAELCCQRSSPDEIV